MRFSFIGRVPSSKSLMNRALIVKSFFPALEIVGNSYCDDVLLMQSCIETVLNIKKPREIVEINCGHAGTVLRFLAPRVVRESGDFILTGSTRLFERPQKPLQSIVGQLGGVVTMGENYMKISADGWHLMGDAVYISSPISSQFASGVLLNCWGLPHQVCLSIPKEMASVRYLEMTVEFLKDLGMVIISHGHEYIVPAAQNITKGTVEIEPDISSVFTLATAAALFGEGKFLAINDTSLQPDIQFLNIFQAMGVRLELAGTHLNISETKELKPININLNSCPDLFPVLAVMTAFCKGKSHLFGAEHLIFKESNRIENTYKLLNLVGIKCEKVADGIIIHGGTEFKKDEVEFDPDHDHRMAMAAGLLILAGCKINIKNPEVVNKSFPDFFNILGVEI